MVIKIFLVVSIVGLLLLGCHDNKPNTDVTRNLFVNGVFVQADQALGHEGQFTIYYTLNAENITERDVDINFYMIDVTSVSGDVGNESIDLKNDHLITYTTLRGINSGVFLKSIDIMIPHNSRQGEYRVIAQVDPYNKINESKESDNWLTEEMIDSMSESDRAARGTSAFSTNTFVVKVQTTDDLNIEKHSIGQSAIIFNSPTSIAHSALRSHLVGYIEAHYSGEQMVDSMLYADILIDGVWQPIDFWHTDPTSSQGEYKPTLAFDFDREHDSAHMGFDLVFSKEHRQALYDSFDNSPGIQNELMIRLNLMPDDNAGFQDSNTGNNIVNINIPYYFYPDEESTSGSNSSFSGVKPKSERASSALIDLNTSYNKVYGNKSKIAAEIQLDGGVSIDPILAGGSAYASGSFNAHLFDFKAVIVGVKFNADAYLLADTGYLLEMTFLNTTVFTKEGPEKDPNANELPTWTVTYEEKFERSRDIVTSRFFIGPVPLSVTAGVSGNVGFSVEAGYDGQLFIRGDLFSAAFSGYANGGIDLLLIEAGIAISIVIIENNFTLASSLGLTLATDSLKPIITYQASLVDKLDVIRGEFGLFAKVVGVEWCKKWIFPYPCGTKESRYSFWFYKTPSLFDKEFTLYTNEGIIEL
jgi:hypothetical protein